MSDKTKGEKNKSAKLTAFQVYMIREAIARPKICASLGRDFNVTRKNISLIRQGKSWAWL